jgi:uncharacterized Rmd1/YagE family protein
MKKSKLTIGVVVMWGFTAEEEKQILQDLLPFQEESFGNM